MDLADHRFLGALPRLQEAREHAEDSRWKMGGSRQQNRVLLLHRHDHRRRDARELAEPAAGTDARSLGDGRLGRGSAGAAAAMGAIPLHDLDGATGQLVEVRLQPSEEESEIAELHAPGRLRLRRQLRRVAADVLEETQVVGSQCLEPELIGRFARWQARVGSDQQLPVPKGEPQGGPRFSRRLDEAWPEDPSISFTHPAKVTRSPRSVLGGIPSALPLLRALLLLLGQPALATSASRLGGLSRPRP